MEKDYLSRAGKTILIMILVVCAVSIAMHLAKPSEPRIIYIQKLDIPSAREIQRRLKELDNPRYNPGKLDGIVGRQTQKAWDNYECDKQAKKCFDN